MAQLGHGGPQVGQVDKGLSGFEVLPCPLHLKKFSDTGGHSIEQAMTTTKMNAK